MPKTKRTLDLSGTVLEETAAVLISGAFEPSVKDAVKEGEVVIGELNDFEKALDTARKRYSARANEETERSFIAADSPSEMKSARDAASRRMAIHEAISDIMWANIIHRLGESCAKVSGVGLREGYKIVSYPESKEREDCPMEMIQKHLAALLG
ncbi:MAG: hypothetical protein HGA31_02800 [Candidatus Moranbacteria bacterium]|nr:hypothetical protein [Candidatus Moranbacteria bacterium]